ncbi:acetolactate decarboxylase [Pedobacter nanyangensis]|uniref:acetolactate decarboxylase n=1 Tax=Pedobacter nanyangensis TaxID=1562389 RepID=UPI000DE55508|nr:acetolactate decarboxylase [Pedobacter nanyangensis]
MASRSTLLILCYFLSNHLFAQTSKPNHLYTFGHASAFIGGLYDAHISYEQIKPYGNFGLGAPDKLDGEIVIFNNKFYQTQSSGKTFEVKYTEKTPFVIINNFKSDQTINKTGPFTKSQLFQFLDSVLTKKNGMYAIHIKAKFAFIKTRAFPTITQKPYPPLAQLLPLQHFFASQDIEGDLIGYRLPSYMEGANITGYHFHFLSNDKTKGGHLIDVILNNMTIEIDELDGFSVFPPPTEAFQKFDLEKDRSSEVKAVELGKKN